ncbi:hypothetical protein BWI93_08765 [Siphonobacter sp. BAB-5385]|nr:hypothetical protein BWI93_08765 [Siphonobacter sp. BAB-5385]
MNFMLYEASYEDTLAINYFKANKHTNIIIKTWMVFSSKTMQKFINSIETGRKKNRFQNCTYEFVNQEGTAKVRYGNKPKVFSLEVNGL